MLVTIIRTIILYVIMMIALRLMGKQEMGQLQPYELVIALMIADLATVPMDDPSTPIYKGIFPIITILLAQTIFSYFSLKSQRFAKILSGSPSLLIKNGKIMEKELMHCGYTLDELLEQLRVCGYPDINKVEYAILETNGDVSIILKNQYQPVTLSDLQITAPPTHYPMALIIDGVIQKENLKAINYTEQTLLQELNKLGIDQPCHTFIALLDTQGEFFAQAKGVCSS